MAQKKKYKIFCVTEDAWIPGLTVADEPPEECPNDPSHEVVVDSLSISELISIDNLKATTNPAANDDVNDGYVVGSKWINTASQVVFDCVDNTSGNAVWSKISGSQPGTIGGYICNYGFSEKLDYSQYLSSYAQLDNQKNRLVRSGDNSNGIRYGDASPIIMPFDATIIAATVVLKGAGVDSASIASTVFLNLELWNVGFLGEGTKIGDLVFSINSSTYTIGQWWNSSVNTDFVGSVSLSNDLSKGDRLAVKFISVEDSSSNIAEAFGIHLSLVLESR